MTHLKIHSQNTIDENDKIVHNQDFENIILMIKQSQVRAYSSVNRELIDLYYNLGKYISLKVEQSLWGKGVVKELADYIENTNPDLKGFSDKNLWRMKQFYEAYKDDEKLSTVLRELSWSQNLQIFSRCKTMEEREFYIKKTLKEHYSVRELNRQIDSGLYESIQENKLIVSPVMQELVPNASEIFKDSYTLEFLGLPPKHDEKDLRKALVSNMKQFILELGKDFIFIDEEYRVQVENVVEYALSRSLSPTMIAEYKLHLPDKKLLQKRITALLDNVELTEKLEEN